MAAPTILRQATLVAGKDLRVELRSRVLTNQVLPFGGIVLLVLAFAQDPDRGSLRDAAPGLFWVAVFLAALLALGRSFAIESGRGVRDALRMSGLDGGAVFVGKAAAVAAELLALEVVLGLGVVVLFDMHPQGVPLLVLTAVLATVGLASSGVLYGILAGALHLRETLLPLLVLPVTAPVLLAAIRSWEATIDGVPSEAWPWVGVLGLFSAIYVAFGFAAFEPLMEDG